ncbi:hypothetical protein [Marinactinospora rubrisoli]|uniref:Uncharacterized protein n=1 Tax=Marinactinospora rubrisoli TaxID=2715399 RepID=A0ABW2KCL1_9ACTN
MDPDILRPWPEIPNEATAGDIARAHTARAAFELGRLDRIDAAADPAARTASVEAAVHAYAVAYLMRALMRYSPDAADETARNLSATVADNMGDLVEEWLDGYGIDATTVLQDGRDSVVPRRTRSTAATVHGWIAAVLGLSGPAMVLLWIWLGDVRWGVSALVILVVAGVFGVFYNNEIERGPAGR